jgi:hypothetical protein
VYADHVGKGSDENTQTAERIVEDIKAYEAEYGPIGS